MGLTKFISAYRIVHRLPGRIRIHIPVLEKLPEDWWIFLRPSTELIRMRKGINTAGVQPITGSLLIDYDRKEIDEADILKWLETLVAAFLKLDIPSDPLNEANIGLRFALLRNRLSQEGVTHDLD
ncbi:hypothetical protein D1BOALGB6SA_8016 [Olavius sp. associated proteobacterium Delta 1]|nr:hypothetical protein D1BOALGB6SA_8016 [Olavius sp. associated proteobacterium Delta 1]